MKKIAPYLTLIAAGSFALASCDVDQTEELEMPTVDVEADAGKLPKVEVTEEGELPSVDVDAEGGNLPKFDVDVADVDVKMKEKEITVPVPDVDVKMPKEDEPDGDPITKPDPTEPAPEANQ